MLSHLFSIIIIYVVYLSYEDKFTETIEVTR